MTDSTKAMSDEWRNLDTKKKKKFEDMAAKDKERYENEKSNAPSNGKTKTKKSCDSTNGGLKRPLSAYFLYIEERREPLKIEKPGIPHKELIQIMG